MRRYFNVNLNSSGTRRVSRGGHHWRFETTWGFRPCTFIDLDGEMVAVDGRFFQIPGTGPTREAADSDAVPFAVVTTFHPNQGTIVEAVTSFDDLTRQLDRLRGSNNLFYAACLDGRFAAVHTRAVCKVESGVGLVDAVHSQSEFDLTDVDGTIIRFWTPTYAKTLNISGWHLHFLTAARDGGGHLLQIQAQDLKVQYLKIEQEGVAKVAPPYRSGGNPWMSHTAQALQKLAV
jgi:acetolactate decarboxylase